jgi:uncharacterized protein YbjT (DUF2867 family)
VDRIEGNAHYAGKRAQEELVASGLVPFTIQRATQFYEFAGTVVGWTRQGPVASLPPLLVPPVAASDVGEVLAEIAAGRPQGRATDHAGPEPLDRSTWPDARWPPGGVDAADPELADRRLRCGGRR